MKTKSTWFSTKVSERVGTKGKTTEKRRMLMRMTLMRKLVPQRGCRVGYFAAASTVSGSRCS
jgi:hypothetical protein